MRLWIKLIALLAVTAGAQYLANRYADAIDYAGFVTRIACAQCLGRDEFDAALIAEADQLRERQMGRHWRDPDAVASAPG